eukprot:270041-Pelagomonas_calceolata.AAC.2
MLGSFARDGQQGASRKKRGRLREAGCFLRFFPLKRKFPYINKGNSPYIYTGKDTSTQKPFVPPTTKQEQKGLGVIWRIDGSDWLQNPAVRI